MPQNYSKVLYSRTAADIIFIVRLFDVMCYFICVLFLRCDVLFYLTFSNNLLRSFHKVSSVLVLAKIYPA